MVKDIQPGVNGNGVSDLVTMGSTVFFSANDGTAGYELWTTDGTAAGTVMVAEIAPGAASSGISEMVSVDGMLYFNATDGSNGYELWKSDGTAAGTELVKDIAVGTPSSSPNNLVAMGGNIYFIAAESTGQGNELWRTDGTEAGTVLVKNINPVVNNSSINNSSSRIRFLNALDDKLYFTARPDPASTVNELWVSDGSEAGTLPLFDADNVNYLMSTGEAILFSGWDVLNGHAMWTTDGTVAGTIFLKDIEPGAADTDFFSLGEAYFHENDAAPW